MKQASLQGEELWSAHDREWRDPAEVAAHWSEAGEVDPRLLKHRVSGRWWETLAELDVTLLVSREYEHLLLSICGRDRRIAYMRLPHPSGLAVSPTEEVLNVASTRNPNQVLDFGVMGGVTPREDIDRGLGDVAAELRPLVPLRSRFLPGSLYIHDLAYVGGRLHANAVGQNAVVEVGDSGGWRRAWWPASLDRLGPRAFGRNFLQLNSIAAGPTLKDCHFSASAETPSARRPSHLNFPVDRRGVIFSGRTREPVVRGLTRPHSARTQHGHLYVDNSGYGEFGVVKDGRFEVLTRLPGWSRGLHLRPGVAFVGTSRVIPRFQRYAPGLRVESARCGIHAVELASGRVLGSLEWPLANQVFAIEGMPAATTRGFLFTAGAARARRRERQLFYAFTLDQRA